MWKLLFGESDHLFALEHMFCMFIVPSLYTLDWKKEDYVGLVLQDILGHVF